MRGGTHTHANYSVLFHLLHGPRLVAEKTAPAPLFFDFVVKFMPDKETQPVMMQAPPPGGYQQVVVPNQPLPAGPAVTPAPTAPQG